MTIFCIHATGEHPVSHIKYNFLLSCSKYTDKDLESMKGPLQFNPWHKWWDIRKDCYYFYCSAVDEPYCTASRGQTCSKILLVFLLVRYILSKWYSTSNSISFMDKFTQRAEFLTAGIIPLLKSILFDEYYVWNILRRAIK